ncbi:MAG: hypothetical protein ABGX20_11245 [Bacillus sp. (in: firmicutes)]
MKTIAYYISDYGYGHASRSIAIIRNLLIEPKVKVIICHSFALSFLMKSLSTNRVKYRRIKTDIGYFLEKDSIQPNKEKLLNEYKDFIADWDYYFIHEREFLIREKVDLVISDISPIPFEAANSIGIPTIGISNFTWYNAYQGLINEVELKPYKDAYQKMTYFYSLAGCQERWNIKKREYGFFSREIENQEVKKIRRLVDPFNNKFVIFLGLGMKIDVGSLELLPIWKSPNCSFLISSNIDVNLPNLLRIPCNYLESQNYIAASDLVISKAGWGIVGEALIARIPLLILNRPSMKEDQNTINYLQKRHLCGTIDWDDFKAYQVDRFMYSNMKREMDINNLCNNNQAMNISSDILMEIF